jgi:hypothetical protein
VALKIAQCFSAGFNRASSSKSRRDERKPLPSLAGLFHLVDALPSLEMLGYYQPNKSALDRNWQVSFHKPTMKIVDGKISHAQSRACSAA